MRNIEADLLGENLSGFNRGIGVLKCACSLLFLCKDILGRELLRNFDKAGLQGTKRLKQRRETL